MFGDSKIFLANPKPARIPPQTPSAGGKSAEAGRIRNPRQIASPCRVHFISFNHLDFARNSFELCPTNTVKSCYSHHVATVKRSKKLENLVEQKILEFFGDPDSGLTLKKSFLTILKKRMRKAQKLAPHSTVLKQYGISSVGVTL